jgi:hypothetical protein
LSWRSNGSDFASNWLATKSIEALLTSLPSQRLRESRT